VRGVLLILALLCGLGWWGVRVDADRRGTLDTPPVVETSWRHTKDGWQRADDWLPSKSANGSFTLTDFFMHRRANVPHPGVTASFLLLASLWCLVAFAPQDVTETEGR
jgi:hypothetical protein